MLIITPLYASALAILCLVLAFAVVKQRLKNKVALADGDNKDVATAMRAHANFVEYVPLALILLAVAELNQANSYVLHALGATLLFARVWHAHGFLTSSAAIPKGRFWGTILTICVVLGLVIINLLRVLQHYI